MIKPPNKRISELGLEGIDALQYDAINIIEDIVENEGLNILRATILSSPKGIEPRLRPIGEGKCEIEITPEVVRVPRRSHIIIEDYTEKDLLFDLKETKTILEEEYPEYNVKMYIESMELLDKGSAPNYPHTIIVFNKTDTVNPDSEIGKFLGNETMPLDLVGIYKAIWNKKKNIYKKGVPIIEMSDEVPFVRAREVFRYTRNVYDSNFTMIRKCEVRKEMKTIPVFTVLLDALCSEDEKYPEGLVEEVSEEILEGENEVLESSKKLSENEDREQKAKKLDKQTHEIEKV